MLKFVQHQLKISFIVIVLKFLEIALCAFLKFYFTNLNSAVAYCAMPLPLEDHQYNKSKTDLKTLNIEH